MDGRYEQSTETLQSNISMTIAKESKAIALESRLRVLLAGVFSMRAGVGRFRDA
jgi:hypothetical protein